MLDSNYLLNKNRKKFQFCIYFFTSNCMMSLRMEIEKKKKQEEMRRLMAERKKKGVPLTKIDNPLAKYNNAGQLTCILCSSVVRSENVWQVHLNSKQHRNNVEQAKKLKELTNNFTVNKPKLKRSNEPLHDAPDQKKPKGILKNATPIPIVTHSQRNNPNVVLYHNEEIKRAPLNIVDSTPSKVDGEPKNVKDALKSSKEEEQTSSTIEQPIPEGFFDDPILDAKVRNIEYKDPVEEEWEKFRKEIKEEASASAEIIAGEQEEATAERQIDEIDEQIRNWSRVLDLELKKDETKKKIQEVEQMSESENNSEEDDEIDEFLDWRAKKA